MRPVLRLVFVVLAVVVLNACISGKFQYDGNVARSFQNLSVPPNYHYWYLNQENNPYALVGLDPEWRFSDVQWHPVTPGSETFKKVVALVEGFPVANLTTFGAELFDQNGNRIGVYYSSLPPGIKLDPELKSIMISTDEPWRSPY